LILFVSDNDDICTPVGVAVVTQVGDGSTIEKGKTPEQVDATGARPDP
jgi:hypothetical protein